MGNLAAHVSLASDVDPEEQLESAHQTIQTQLASDVLETVKACSPAFFEQLVVDLIVGMGYGGSHKEAGEAVGGSGDGGIDGIIKDDRLGLDAIYLQAKRWEGSGGSANRRLRPIPLWRNRDITLIPDDSWRFDLVDAAGFRFDRVGDDNFGGVR